MEIRGYPNKKAGKIYLNREASPKKQFFTAAHEFGHWVLHRSLYLAKLGDYALMPRQRVLAGGILEVHRSPIVSFRYPYACSDIHLLVKPSLLEADAYALLRAVCVSSYGKVEY